MELCMTIPMLEEGAEAEFVIMPQALTEAQRHKRLERDASSAVQLLKELWEQRDGSLCHTLHPAIVRTSQALAFITHHIVGLGVGYGHGCGFILRRLEGEGRWSAPSYFHIRNVALGVVVGRRRLQSLLCIKDDSTLKRFMGTEAYVGSDLRCGCGLRMTRKLASEASCRVGRISKGGRLTPERLEWAWCVSPQPLALTYTLAKGTLLDASFKTGVLTQDEDLDKQLMGPFANPHTLLHGEVKQPVEFAELYGLLNRLSNWEELTRSWSAASLEDLLVDSPRSDATMESWAVPGSFGSGSLSARADHLPQDTAHAAQASTAAEGDGGVAATQAVIDGTGVGVPGAGVGSSGEGSAEAEEDREAAVQALGRRGPGGSPSPRREGSLGHCRSESNLGSPVYCCACMRDIF